MKYLEKKDAVLLLQDGTVFKGKSVGITGISTGELCYNIGMSGYQEIFTDPSYFGQIMTMTNVHIGNYGVHPEEIESSSIKISGLVCKSFSAMFSRGLSAFSLKDYFERDNIVAICDVDTRAVVRHVRDKGAMNAVISTETTDIEHLKGILAKVPSMEGLELSSKVTAKSAYCFNEKKTNSQSSIVNSQSFRVAVLDLGVKRSILQCLVDRGCFVKVFPMNSTVEEMTAWEPDGFLISNGPGDPAAMPAVVKTTAEIINRDYPVFGICLGQQLIAETCGIRTYKMFNGHRGINHPIKNLITGKCEVTSQNHGFGVIEEDVRNNKDIEITHINLNDDTIEGFRIKHKKVFCVQYHPEASPGPHDARYLFDRFMKVMEVVKVVKVQ